MPGYRVKLFPQQQSFISGSKQSVLEAALGAGINITHGCSSGQCGKCIARLIKGNIRPTKHSDFPLSHSHREAGFFVTCCYAAHSDLEIEIQTIKSTSQVSEQKIDTRVYRIQKLSDDVVALTLKTPRNQHLDFLAGQYITVDFGNGLKRNKSLANCPCESMKLEIHVQHDSNDPFSDHVFGNLRKNDIVKIHGPWGEFTLGEKNDRPIVFIAYDTGFASIKSLIEQAIALDCEQAIDLYWLYSRNAQPYLENYCRSLTDAFDNISFASINGTPGQPLQVSSALRQILTLRGSPVALEIYAALPAEYFPVIKQVLRQVDSRKHMRLHLDCIAPISV